MVTRPATEPPPRDVVAYGARDGGVLSHGRLLRDARRPSRRQRSGRTICGVPHRSDESDSTTRVAEALRRRAADWSAGAQEGRELDRRIARRQSPQERLDSGRELVELAAKLRRPD